MKALIIVRFASLMCRRRGIGAPRVAAGFAAVCLDRQSRDLLAPTPGRWKAVETLVKAKCAVPIKPKGSPDLLGTLKVSEDGNRLVASGFIAGQKAKDELSRSPEKGATYKGTSTMRVQGQKAKIKLVWDAVGGDSIAGRTTASFKVNGKPCTIVRDFQMELTKPAE